MTLAVAAPIEPMLAKRVTALPEGEGWLFEPKWDGFRALLFRDGDEWHLQSRDLKPLGRYFPELRQPSLSQLPERVVLDGEIVIAQAGEGLDFETLLLRIHPAASRIKLLSEQSPASLVLWDLLCLGDEDLRSRPFAERRARLVQVLSAAEPPLLCTPATRDRSVAADWFNRFEGAGFDGVVAKRLDGHYEPGKRTMLKVKHLRTADCVVGGYRWHKRGKGKLVGSLLLGLYDDDGKLHHVGVVASFKDQQRRELVAELEPLRQGAEQGHPWREWMTNEQLQRMPGGTSRWSGGKQLDWVALRPERVIEVRYDHMQGTRFRHTTHFVRWRPDKAATDCRYDQLEVTAPYELRQIFSPEGSRQG